MFELCSLSSQISHYPLFYYLSCITYHHSQPLSAKSTRIQRSISIQLYVFDRLMILTNIYCSCSFSRHQWTSIVFSHRCPRSIPLSHSLLPRFQWMYFVLLTARIIRLLPIQATMRASRMCSSRFSSTPQIPNMQLNH